MQEGLLWYDNDPRRKLADKVDHAAARYKVKFGRRPTFCYVNEVDLAEQSPEIKGIRLQTKSNVLRHHFFVGEDKRRAVKAA